MFQESGFGVDQFVQLLVLLRHGESLSVGCTLWTELRTWLRSAAGTWQNFSLNDHVIQVVSDAVSAKATGKMVGFVQ